ncbi:MAG: hypothetical protein FJX69_12970, partial [Alphaproteobacteria bacterium]|nr:hypothetical protein [Alphaproteobacteria bacterium]
MPARRTGLDPRRRCRWLQDDDRLRVPRRRARAGRRRARGAAADGPVAAIDATPHLDADPVQADAIRLGDAALAIDPISSSGVQKAIQGALAGAVVANTLLRRPDDAPAAIAFYRDMLAEASRRHARWTAGHYATVSRGVRDAFWSARAGAGAADDVPGAAARALDPAEFGRARLVASPQPARRRAALPGRRLRRRAQGCRASRPRRAGRLPGRPGGRAAAGRHGPRPHGPRARAGMAGKDAAARGTGDSGLDGRARPAAARGRGRGRARMSRDVSIWLRDNALGQFATAFVENDVDWTALQILTDADLKELGLSFGPRKRLLALLAEEKRRRRLY